MPINYVICAAGEGRRFGDIFANIYKPLIKLYERTLFEWALLSLSILQGDKIIIITQMQQMIKKKLYKTIKRLYPFNELQWIELDYLTKGQLETALVSTPYCDINNPTVIYNCDTYFQSKTLLNMLNDETIDGVIPCSAESGHEWSFCKIDNSGKVLEVAEKKRISEWATVGFYSFKTNKIFIEYAERHISKNKDSAVELYVAPLYNDMIADGLNIVIDKVHSFRPMGTPEQIQKYWELDIKEVINSSINKVIVVDLDNSITIEDPKVSYPEKTPNIKIINKLKEYKKMGYRIIIYSARRMLTHKNNEAAIIAEIGKITIDWLNKYEIPFDGLKFGKPFAENGFYVDDKSIRPDEFLNLSVKEIDELIKKSAENSI